MFTNTKNLSIQSQKKKFKGLKQKWSVHTNTSREVLGFNTTRVPFSTEELLTHKLRLTEDKQEVFHEHFHYFQDVLAELRFQSIETLTTMV